MEPHWNAQTTTTTNQWRLARDTGGLSRHHPADMSSSKLAPLKGREFSAAAAVGRTRWQTSPPGGPNERPGNTDCPRRRLPASWRRGHHEPLPVDGASKQRRPAGRSRASLLAATIFILIAYELFVELAINHRRQVRSSQPACQRCLPNLFIRSCSAAATNRTELAAATTAGPLPSAQESGALSTSAASNRSGMNSPANQSHTTTETIIKLTGAAANTTATTASTNRRPAHHHQTPTVLCNSRCNCVILQQAMIFAPEQQQQQPANLSLVGPSNELWRGGTPNQSEPLQAAATPIYLATNNGSAFGGLRQQQQQQQLQLQLQRTEQALIAFNEDYSLDYEHSGASPNGSGGPDDTGAPDVEPTSNGSADQRTTTTATTSGITNPMPANNAHELGTNIPMTPLQLTAKLPNQNYSQPSATAQQTGLDYTSPKPSAAGDGRAGETGPSASVTVASAAAMAKATPDPSGALVSPGSSRQVQLQVERARVATPPSTSINGNRNADLGAKDELGAPAPGQPSPPAMTLFPLPTRLRAHHHPHQHQPLGAGSGREASGPQLYAQSLYSSQAPKLSYHAHTPYLKSQVQFAGGPTSGQQQQQQQQPVLADPHRPGAPSASVQGAYSPFQNSYPHLRHQNYLGHYLRQVPPISGKAAAVSSPTLAQTNDYTANNNYTPQQRVLVALRALDMSGKLKLSGPNANASAASQPNDNEMRDTNWLELPELMSAIETMLIGIEQNDIQSLVLRDNGLQFELWSELYALLALHLRQHLFHLDLSHNGLAKLGITFTGYIEHHLAAHGTWPFAASNQLHANVSASNASESNELALQSTGAKQVKPVAASGRIPSPRSKHSLLSGGKLYTLMQQRLHSRRASFSSNQTGNQRQQVGPSNLTHVSPLQQALLLRALDLSHNKLKWLINDQFRALKHVQTIRLDHNRIRYIHQHAFSGLESLRFLNLNFNRLQVIYIEQFQTNYNLLALMLRSNYLAYLRGGSFASLANLKRLDLSSNKLTVLSNNAFIGLESLELLNCSSNQFIHAPSASLHPLTSLKRLDLSDNLIAQLVPGTFFHLPLEELSLNQNEQLVGIDRGAFWDLPYLQRLYLKSNPMLAVINSQAFVGTQSLQTIDVHECQSLDEPTRQMLDNVTMTATSRLLRNEQSRNSIQQGLGAKTQHHFEEFARSGVIGETNSSSPAPENPTNFQNTAQETQQQSHNKAQLHSGTTSPRHSMHQPANESGGRLQTCIYYLGTVALLVVALKLVFKFTSTSRYMEARRRRRRVFEMGKAVEELDFESADSGSMSRCSASNVFPMCVQPDSLVLKGSAELRPQQRQSPEDPEAVGDLDGANTVDQRLFGAELSEGRQPELAGEQELAEEASGCPNDTNNVIRETASAGDTDEALEARACCPDCSGSPTNRCSSQLQLLGGQIDAIVDHDNQQVSGSDTSSTATCCQIGNHLGDGGPEAQAQSAAHLMEQQRQCLPNGDTITTGNQPTTTIDLIHSQLVAAGFDYGHAHCAHFYQSLGPALQFADLTANIVGNMDYY